MTREVSQILQGYNEPRSDSKNHNTSIRTDCNQNYPRTQQEQQHRRGSLMDPRQIGSKFPKFRYTRPEFLQLKTEDEILVSADHQIRPIILPRDVNRLPWKSGYAECINAGKSARNEDQAACHQEVLVRDWITLKQNNLDLDAVGIENKLPYVYFGIFDGHAGTAVAVAAANQLHNIISEKLSQIADLLMELEFEQNKPATSGGGSSGDEDDDFVDAKADEGESRFRDSTATKSASGGNNTREKELDHNIKSNTSPGDKFNATSNDNIPNMEMTSPISNSIVETSTATRANSSKFKRKPHTTDRANLSTNRFQSDQNEESSIFMADIVRNNISVDSLISGALESSFWEMDEQIARDKHDYKMPGGCTAIVGVFILGKLYVCNAGDSRAIVCKNNEPIPMSNDFTPLSERERILRLGMQRPEFLGNDFTHLEFVKRPTRKDLGKQMLYRDAYMRGWAMKTITYDDLKFPLVWGEGKRSRVLATIGVTRGFGDHELRAIYGSVLIKPFLTPEPEVKILPLEHDNTLTPEDVLIIGSDGLWDVTTNEDAAEIIKNSFDLFPDDEDSRSKYRYITAAQDLVIHSRGHTTMWDSVWRNSKDYRMASLDDIAVFVIPLKQYRDEYREWKEARIRAIMMNSMSNSESEETSGTSTSASHLVSEKSHELDPNTIIREEIPLASISESNRGEGDDDDGGGKDTLVQDEAPKCDFQKHQLSTIDDNDDEIAQDHNKQENDDDEIEKSNQESGQINLQTSS